MSLQDFLQDCFKVLPVVSQRLQMRMLLKHSGLQTNQECVSHGTVMDCCACRCILRSVACSIASPLQAPATPCTIISPPLLSITLHQPCLERETLVIFRYTPICVAKHSVSLFMNTRHVKGCKETCYMSLLLLFTLPRRQFFNNIVWILPSQSHIFGMTAAREYLTLAVTEIDRCVCQRFANCSLFSTKHVYAQELNTHTCRKLPQP
jgi:hypothetical protein